MIDYQDLVDNFHMTAYDVAKDGISWGGATWCGVKTWKWPGDLQVYQELLWDLKPQIVIETGTAYGGSALFFAHMLDQLGCGKVVSVDLAEVQGKYPRHPRITYIGGRSSVDDVALMEVRRWAGNYPGPTLVVLDSDHKKDHVLAELNAYGWFVPPGSWLVVEDTNVNGHPVYPDHGPGPQEALDEWLPKHPDFVVDEKRAGKYLFSMHTWLRRRRV